MDETYLYIVGCRPAHGVKVCLRATAAVVVAARALKLFLSPNVVGVLYAGAISALDSDNTALNLCVKCMVCSIL